MRVGSEIGAYRIVRKIGQGGMGEVFLGEHALLGRPAAIKVLLPEMSARRSSVERFFNEARATSSVSDPGIVQIFDFGFTAEGVAYIVMEYLEGEPLNRRLRRLRSLPALDTIRIGRQVAGSLAAAHAASIVHRDLKPENLFIVRDADALGGERPKILDFGVAKLGDGYDRIKTHTGVVMGTPMYMSPEQCRGKGDVDHRADIYSLGCVLYHLVVGEPPFVRDGLGPVMLAHVSEAPRPPSEVSATTTPWFDELVLRCMAKKPDDRFQSMLEVQRACDAFLSSAAAMDSAVTTGVAATPTPTSLAPLLEPSTERPSLLRRSPLLRWVAMGTGAVAVGVIVAIAVTRGGPEVAPVRAPPVAAPTPPLPPVEKTVLPRDRENGERTTPAEPGPTTSATIIPATKAVDAATDPQAAKPATPKHVVQPKPRPKPTKPAPTSEGLYDDR